MKKFKDLNACVASLRALLGRNDIEPEQRKDVEDAIELVRRFRRKAHPTTADTFRCVRRVTELLARAFVRDR